VSALEVDFLTDGGQTAETVSAALVAFIAAATRTLDVAIYDFHAREGASARVADALEAASARGVSIRVAFNVDRPRHPSAPRPMEANPDEIDGLEVPTRGVRDENALMHHKFVVRDGEAVWTGSTNWTDDAFSREENAVIRVESPSIADDYTRDFQKLLTHRRVDPSGGAGTVTTLDGRGHGPPLLLPQGSVAGAPRRRAPRRRATTDPDPVAGHHLGGHPRDARGVHRPGFVRCGRRVRRDADGRGHVRVALHSREPLEDRVWDAIAPRLSGKRSTPYAEGAVHDYMHAKSVVADDEVLTGSFNCSRNGESNAENVLHITAEPIAERFAAFTDTVAARYAASPTSDRQPERVIDPRR
jgi:phosphatidylserine/phosphatidylglycerophosphate/cardiolipin synthase-like enzyme